METPTVQIAKWNIPAPVAVAAWVGLGVPVFVWTIESYRQTVGNDVTVSETPRDLGIASAYADPRISPIAKPIILAERADERPLPLVQKATQIVGKWLGFG